MEHQSPDIPGLSTGCLVKILLREGLLVIQQRFSRNTKDERSLSWGQGDALLRMTDYALDHPKNGWDVLLDSRDRPATIVKFNREIDDSRPGGPGIVRFEVKRVRFLFDLHNCRKFRTSLKEALDLLVVSGVMES
jgi:hypothetical protein